MSCGVGHRRGLDPTLLWLWRRLAVTAPIRPLAWEPPCAKGAAQEMVKRQKKKEGVFHNIQFITLYFYILFFLQKTRKQNKNFEVD